ncbi:MAG: TRAP transporter small permease [Alphaproteobacteria bacterium]|nr:TRAP transporter small permease [Alphaproteobacteria bacterium]
MIVAATWLARVLSWVAAAGLLGMVAVNVVDVTLRAGLNKPIFGAYELVELGLAACAFLAMPETFLRGGHIRLEMIETLVPRRIVRGLDVFGALATMGFLVVLLWHMVEPIRDMVRYKEVTFDLHMPVVFGGALVALGLVGSLLVVLIVFVRDPARAFDARPER